MWHSQIDKITQKIAYGIGAMERIRPFLPPATIRSICNALVQRYSDKLQKISISGLYGAFPTPSFPS